MDFLFPSSKKIKTYRTASAAVPATRFSVGSVKSIRSATLSEIPTGNETVDELVAISKCPTQPDHLFVSPVEKLTNNETDPHDLGAQLTKAILSKQYDTLLGLLQRGANPNFPLQSPVEALHSEVSADSPLFVAAMLDDVRAASDLIDYGASITGNVAAKDIDFSPLGVAIKQKNYAVLELFLKTINSLYEVDYEPEDQEEQSDEQHESDSHEENDADYTEEVVEHKIQGKNPKTSVSTPPTSRTSSSNSLPISPTSPTNGLPRNNSASSLPIASTTTQSNRPAKRQRED